MAKSATDLRVGEQSSKRVFLTKAKQDEFMTRQKEFVDRKKERLEVMRLEKSKLELAPCTFQPFATTQASSQEFNQQNIDVNDPRLSGYFGEVPEMKPRMISQSTEKFYHASQENLQSLAEQQPNDIRVDV